MKNTDNNNCKDNLIDISMEISPNMPVYKGRKSKKPIFKNLSNHEKDNIHETEITLSLHTGTHVDAPLHMIDNGEDSEIFKPFITRCKVLNLTNVNKAITHNHLQKFNIEDNDFILLKTKNSFKKGTRNFIYLKKNGAEYLISKNIKGVGIDSLGIEREQPDHPTHKKLLVKKIILIEGLNLKNVKADQYKLYFFPLNIKGVEALPVKVLLKTI